VRKVPISLRKSSTAFSMRVLAAAIASFVVAIVVMSFLDQNFSLQLPGVANLDAG
jgi:hypothetical protein